MPSISGFSLLRAATAAILCSQLALPAGVLAAQEPAQKSAAPAISDEQSMSMTSASHAKDPLEKLQREGGSVLMPPEAQPLAPDNVLVARPQEIKSSPLTGDARLLLVLNRFTYGPRPGDLEHLRQIGLQQWFHDQLNPATIDDSKLEARLAEYPAMKLPLEKLFAEFPSNQQVRQAVKGKGRGDDGNTGDASGRAVFAMREEAYRRREEAKQDAAKKDADGDPMDKKDARREANAEMAQPLPATPAQFIAMPPAQRFKALCKLNIEQLQQLRRQLDNDQRGHLIDGFTPSQVETLAAFNGPNEVVASEDVQTKILRDIYSERQLQEVMVDFWLNHFNVYMKKSDPAPYYIAQYQRDVIRPFALGNFQDLLLATAQSPAMLDYLDQSESVGPHSAYATRQGGGQKKAAGLNENYAREVMELHTIGVDGGYTQKDVTELAKVLTGWTVLRGYNRGVNTRAVYDPTKHEPGTKTVLGHTIKENGLQEGYTVLKMLASSPQCAHFISQKLAIRFVSDNPPKALVDRMTGTFLETHGNIRAVLASMVNSPEFFTAATYRSKVKTPQDFVISAVRATGADVDNPSALAKAMADLGQPLFGHQTPDGYSMKSEAWNSTTALVNRMNFSMALASNRVQGVHTDLDRLLGPNPTEMTARQKQDDIESRLLHIRVSPRTEQLIAQETTAPPDQQQAQLKQVAALRGGGVRYGKGKNDNVRPGILGQPGIPSDPALDLQAALATGLVLGSPEFQRR